MLQPKTSSPAIATASAADTGRGVSGLRGDAYPAALPGAAASASQCGAYRWIQEPASRESGIEREVLMTAHEGSEYAERAERRDIGEATLEQFRADVTLLSHEYMTGELFLIFLEMRRVRNPHARRA
jgi:hypothetical protein